MSMLKKIKDMFSKNMFSKSIKVKLIALLLIITIIPILILGVLTFQNFKEVLKKSEIDESVAQSAMIKLRNSTLFVVFIVAILIVIGTVFITRDIVNPLRKLSAASSKIAEGDLTITYSIRKIDEIGALADNLTTMVGNIGFMMAKLQAAANQIGSASNEILAASQQQSASAREQSSAVSETTAAAEELSKSAEQVGENIKAVTRAASQTMTGMTRIKGEIGKAGEIIALLNEKSQKIGKITELIDDVTDQTNLLAVNAAIEAARAGEQGRGFTVVADEIRKLSDSTAKSTKDIAGLIEIIQHEMRNAIISMEQSVISVSEELKSAHETAERAKEISMSVTQQISGSKQIAEAMSNIDETMKQITSGAQETQVAVKQLTELAGGFKDVTDMFKL